MEYILQMHQISKNYKNQKALDNLDINIEKGDIYGFVGENGSGKTTVIRLISGLIFPTSGNFELFGIKNTDNRINEARKRIGAVVETPSIYLNMTAMDNLKIQSSLLGVKNNNMAQILKDVGLEDQINSKKLAKNFSLGMRQRLGIAMALIGNPEFLLLDEPMNGLDPAGIVEIRELILKLNHEKHITFLISSHILTELSLVATKYGIISHGHMLKEITSKELEYECRKSIIIKAKDKEKLRQAIESIVSNDKIDEIDEGYRIFDSNINDILKVINKYKIEIESINCQDANIEQYYLSLLGGK